MKKIEERVAEAASDYKMAIKNNGFAEEFGGLDAIRTELFALVDLWEGEADEKEGGR